MELLFRIQLRSLKMTPEIHQFNDFDFLLAKRK